MPDLVRLGGRLELRTNWQVYAEEFARALQLYGVRDAAVSAWMPSSPISAFERKYAASGHQLYRVIAELGHGRCAGDVPGGRDQNS